MSYRCTSETKANEWNHKVSDSTLLELAAKGALPVKKVRQYISEGRLKIDMLLCSLDFGEYGEGAQVLKKYYPELFLMN